MRHYELRAREETIRDVRTIARYLEDDKVETEEPYVLRIWEDGAPAIDEYLIEVIVDDDTDLVFFRSQTGEDVYQLLGLSHL